MPSIRPSIPRRPDLSESAVEGRLRRTLVAAAAITDGAVGPVGGVVTLSGSSETDIASLTRTTTGGQLEVSANFYLTVWHPGR